MCQAIWSSDTHRCFCLHKSVVHQAFTKIPRLKNKGFYLKPVSEQLAAQHHQTRDTSGGVFLSFGIAALDDVAMVWLLACAIAGWLP